MQSTRGEIPYLVGWRNGAVVVSWKAGLCAYDPGTHTSLGLEHISGGGWRTDGTTLAGSAPDDAGRDAIAFVDKVGDPTLTAAPPWYPDFLDLGNDLVPLIGGGYLFARLPQLGLLGDDGRLTTERLPDGLLGVAGTSDPARFLVRRPPVVDPPDAFIAPYQVLLWRRGDSIATPLLEEVVAVSPATEGLAWLQHTDGSWWLVGDDGIARSMIPPVPSQTTTPDPGTTLVLVETDRALGCESATPPSCRIELRTAEGIALSGVLATRQSAMSWQAGSVAFLPLSTGPSGAPTELVVLGATGVERVPLPG